MFCLLLNTVQVHHYYKGSGILLLTALQLVGSVGIFGALECCVLSI